MPNVASVFKEEIVRLARKEVRAETESLKKAVTQYRSDIAALKRRLASLEKQTARVEKRASSQLTSEATQAASTRTRFSAKGLASHRQRLGLTAAELGELLNVSAQTVYNWEAEKSKPRPTQLTAIASLRGMGKRQAQALLADLTV